MNKIQNKIKKLGEEYLEQNNQNNKTAAELIKKVLDILEIHPEDYDDIEFLLEDTLFNPKELHQFISVFIQDMIKKVETKNER